MERLTRKLSDGTAYTGAVMDADIAGVNYPTYIGKAVDKLAAYEDAEEQGLLLRLPCKVGDTVYVPTRNFISELRITEVTCDRNGTYLRWVLLSGIYPNLNGFAGRKIGNEVFLTKSEAEVKLAELNCFQNGNS